MLIREIQLKKNPGANRRKIGRAILPTILYAILLITNGCAGLQSKSSDPANVNKPSITENDRFITSINGEPFKDENARYEGGYRVEIEGTFPDPSTNGFIVVKSDRLDHYIIQPHVVRTTRTSWIGQAFLGEPEKGIGESFSVFAIFTPDTFEEWQKLEREPAGIKSATITYRRTRN